MARSRGYAARASGASAAAPAVDPRFHRRSGRHAAQYFSRWQRPQSGPPKGGLPKPYPSQVTISARIPPEPAPGAVKGVHGNYQQGARSSASAKPPVHPPARKVRILHYQRRHGAVEHLSSYAPLFTFHKGKLRICGPVFPEWVCSIAGKGVDTARNQHPGAPGCHSATCPASARWLRHTWRRWPPPSQSPTIMVWFRSL